MSMLYYHASHEQFTPQVLLHWAMLAETAGFDGVNSSDHFYPWSERQGESGFSFAWLGSALQATRFVYGMVCAPGPRYHPVVIAQAAATLSAMFPGRFWMALGSGEALNEKVTGEPWPDKAFRNKRLYEASQVIKRLLQGETLTHDSTFRVDRGRLYTLPEQPPFLLAAAVTEATAEWLGSWADGLITIHKPLHELEAMIKAFRKGGGINKPLYLKVQLSYARSYQEALDGAMDQWRTNVLPMDKLGDLSTPEEFDLAARQVSAEEVEKMVHIAADPAQHIEWIRQYQEMGFEHIILHNVNRQQELFIRDFGKYVLPALKARTNTQEA